MKSVCYPEFTWNEFFWITSVHLPSWSGFQVSESPYGAVSSERESSSNLKIMFAPEGRGDEPLNENELSLVQWVIDNESQLHDAVVGALYDKYPSIRQEFSEYLEENEADELLPYVKSPEEMKKIVGVVSINVHTISKDGTPYLGIELGCTWDDEHGVGILFHGTTLVELGGADTAILLWIAEKHADQS